MAINSKQKHISWVIDNRGSLKQNSDRGGFSSAQYWLFIAYFQIWGNALRELKKTYMYDNARKRIKIQIKKNEITRNPCCLTLCSVQISFELDLHTLARHHAKKLAKKECCVPTGSHVHAGKAMTFSENNGKCRWYFQSINRQIK